MLGQAREALLFAQCPAAVAKVRRAIKSAEGALRTAKRHVQPSQVARSVPHSSGQCPMKPTTKIRFTEPQIALVMRADPNCNLDRLTEVSFEFDQAGTILGCIGTIKDGANPDHDYAGSGLARLYATARRKFTARQTSATVLQFPNGERLAKCIDPGSAWPSSALPGRPASACSRYPRQGRPGPRLPLRTGA